jgi:hypothetical protein
MSDFDNLHADGFTTQDTYTPDKLLDRDTITRKRTIASGAGALTRGTLLGKITASGKYLKSLAAATDGSEDPDAILLHDVDATAADVEAIIAIQGKFAKDGVTFGAGHTQASTEDALRLKNIFIENTVG